MAEDNLEREIKLRFDSAASARRAVLAAGALPLQPRRLQQDALLDAAQALRDRGCALRLRTEDGHSRVTFKGPIQSSTMKLRDEFETSVGDGAILLRIFESLGYRVWFRYEKYREEFSHDGIVVAIDETPVGVFVELEGTEPGIRAMAAALGKSAADYVLDSYRGLFLTHCEAAGLRDGDMVFARPA